MRSYLDAARPDKIEIVGAAESRIQILRPCHARSPLARPSPGFHAPEFGHRFPDPGFQIPDPGFQIPDPGFQIPDSRNAGYQVPESAIRTHGGAPPRPRPGYQISGSGRPGQRPPAGRCPETRSRGRKGDPRGQGGPDPDQDTRFQAPAGRASALRRQMPRNQIPRSQRRPSGPGGPGQSPTYQSPGTGAAPEAAEGGAGAQVPKSGEGEEGREAEGQGGGGRTPGSLVLMKETQETGAEIPPGKLVFP